MEFEINYIHISITVVTLFCTLIATRLFHYLFRNGFSPAGPQKPNRENIFLNRVLPTPNITASNRTPRAPRLRQQCHLFF